MPILVYPAYAVIPGAAISLSGQDLRLSNIVIVNSDAGIAVNNTKGFSASNVIIKNTTNPISVNNSKDVSLHNVNINSDSSWDEWLTPSNIIAIISGIAVPIIGLVLGFKFKKHRRKTRISTD
jgi:hypothetical protein